jgi:hypothetical protein
VCKLADRDTQITEAGRVSPSHWRRSLWRLRSGNSHARTWVAHSNRGRGKGGMSMLLCAFSIRVGRPCCGPILRQWKSAKYIVGFKGHFQTEHDTLHFRPNVTYFVQM